MAQSGEGEGSQMACQVATGRGALGGTTAQGTTRGSSTGLSPHVDATGEARMGLGPHSNAAIDANSSHAANGAPRTDGSRGQTQTGTTLAEEQVLAVRSLPNQHRARRLCSHG
jgi:hypothetical protein